MAETDDIVLQLQSILRQLDDCGEYIAALRLAEAIEVLQRQDQFVLSGKASDDDG